MQSYRYEAKRLASCLTSRGKKIISKHGFGGDLISLSYDDEANHGHRIVKIAHKKADLHIANAIEQVALQIHIYIKDLSMPYSCRGFQDFHDVKLYEFTMTLPFSTFSC